MPIEFIDKMNAVLRQRKMSLKDLAEKIEPKTSISNLSNKLQRGDLRESDMRSIARALDTVLDITLKSKTGEIL